MSDGESNTPERIKELEELDKKSIKPKPKAEKKS